MRTKKIKETKPAERQTTAPENGSCVEDLPEPPAMKTVYGDIEREPQQEAATESAFPEGFQAVDPITDAIVAGKKKDEDTFEPVLLTLKLQGVLQGLSIANEVIQKSYMPILECVKIEATEAGVTMTATDLESFWRRPLTGSGGPVARCIPAHVLLSEIRALPAGTEDLELLFKAHTVSVNGRCDIITQDAEEFPDLDIPQFDGQMAAGMLAAFRKVIPAVSKDSTRYSLCGVYVDFKESKVVGTDGFRMHTEDFTPADPTMKPCIIPLKAAKIIARHGNDMLGWMGNETRTYLPMQSGVFATKPIEGTYPDWKVVKPNPPNTIVFDPEEFLKVIEGANAISEKAGITLSVNGTLTIKSEGGSGTYKWEIAAESSHKGKKPLAYTFNSLFLADAIKAFPKDRVTLQVPDSYGACLLNEKAVIMPIRL